MATKLSIWSGALATMAGAPARSLNDRNLGPIAAVWDTVSAACLTKNQWPWTITRERITDRSEATGYPEIWRFRLPARSQADPGRLLEETEDTGLIGPGPLAVYNAATSFQPVTDWRHQAFGSDGEFIFTDYPQIWIDYQFRAPVPTWPTQFAEWVRLKLCAATATIYTGSQTHAERCAREAEDVYNDLINSTLQAMPPKRLFDRFHVTDVRLGYGDFSWNRSIALRGGFTRINEDGEEEPDPTLRATEPEPENGEDEDAGG